MSSFDALAKDWDKNARRVAVAKNIADHIKKCVGKNLKILDFGCGTGLLSYNLTDIAIKIVGIDNSQKMVEEFNKKSPNLQKIRAYTSFEKIDERFDLVVSSMTLHHIKDIANLIKQLTNYLAPGAKVCIADLCKEDGSFHDRGNEGVYHFGFEPKELIELFASFGFRLLCHKQPFVIKKQKAYPLFLLCFTYHILPSKQLDR